MFRRFDNMSCTEVKKPPERRSPPVSPKRTKRAEREITRYECTIYSGRNGSLRMENGFTDGLEAASTRSKRLVNREFSVTLQGPSFRLSYYLDLK